MAKQAASRTSTSSRKKSSPPAAKVAPVQSEPSHEQIAARAYHLYLSRAAENGDAFQDWLRAERELRAAVELISG